MYQEVVSTRKYTDELFSGLCERMERFCNEELPLMLDCQIHWSEADGQWIATLYYKLPEEE